MTEEELLSGLASDTNPCPDRRDAFERAHVREALQQIPTDQRLSLNWLFREERASKRSPAMPFSARYRQASLAAWHAEIKATLAGI